MCYVLRASAKFGRAYLKYKQKAKKSSAEIFDEKKQLDVSIFILNKHHVNK